MSCEHHIKNTLSEKLRKFWSSQENSGIYQEIYVYHTPYRACSAVVIALRFGTQGPGFEPAFSQSMLHASTWMLSEAKSFFFNHTPWDGLAGKHMRAVVASPPRRAAQLTRPRSIVACCSIKSSPPGAATKPEKCLVHQVPWQCSASRQTCASGDVIQEKCGNSSG